MVLKPNRTEFPNIYTIYIPRTAEWPLLEIWHACLQHSSPLYIIYYSMIKTKLSLQISPCFVYKQGQLEALAILDRIKSTRIFPYVLLLLQERKDRLKSTRIFANVMLLLQQSKAVRRPWSFP